MSLRGAPAFSRNSLQITQKLLRRKEKVSSQRHDVIYFFQFYELHFSYSNLDLLAFKLIFNYRRIFWRSRKG